MYVWEEGLRETTKEQDCFKFSLKNRERRRQLSGVLWKLIPCRWTRMWKRPFSEFRPPSPLQTTYSISIKQIYVIASSYWCLQIFIFSSDHYRLEFPPLAVRLSQSIQSFHGGLLSSASSNRCWSSRYFSSSGWSAPIAEYFTEEPKNLQSSS